MRLSCLVALIAIMCCPAFGREWSDVTGTYKLTADLVGFDDEMVILQRENKELGQCPISQLCAADREYLKSKEAQQIHAETIDKTQTWTTIRGHKVVGRVVDYARESVTVQRRRGKTYVNQFQYKNLPGIYQVLLRRVVSFFENKSVETEADLQRWVLGLKGQPRTFEVEGVMFELENGDEYGVPFFVFSEEDQEILKPGWEAWSEEHKEEDYDDMNDHAFRLQSLAATYHQDQQARRQVAMINLQAIQAGLTSAWEVTLYPAAGNPGPPRWVVTMGRNSEVAKQNALRQYPGFVPGPIRKVSR